MPKPPVPRNASPPQRKRRANATKPAAGTPGESPNGKTFKGGLRPDRSPKGLEKARPKDSGRMGA